MSKTIYSEIWIYAGTMKAYEVNMFILGKYFINSEIL